MPDAGGAGEGTGGRGAGTGGPLCARISSKGSASKHATNSTCGRQRAQCSAARVRRSAAQCTAAHCGAAQCGSSAVIRDRLRRGCSQPVGHARARTHARGGRPWRCARARRSGLGCRASTARQAPSRSPAPVATRCTASQRAALRCRPPQSPESAALRRCRRRITVTPPCTPSPAPDAHSSPGPRTTARRAPLGRRALSECARCAWEIGRRP